MGQRTPHGSEPKQGTVVDWRYLTDGELFGETDPTYVYYSTIHVD